MRQMKETIIQGVKIRYQIYDSLIRGIKFYL